MGTVTVAKYKTEGYYDFYKRLFGCIEGENWFDDYVY